MSTIPEDALTIGVEEEFFLADAATGKLVPRNHEVVGIARELGTELELELCPAQVEITTPVCHSITQVRSRILEARTVAAVAAMQADARLLAVAVPVFGEPLAQVTDTPRYQRMARDYGRLITGQERSGCHVHIGLPDRETAVLVSNHIRPWLPVLLGLSANSAVHHGQDTGFASWRTIQASHWPCSGPPPFWTSAAEYDKAVAASIDCGSVLDEAMIYWDVRPSAHLPTIEIRVGDIPSTVDQTVLLAALLRALVAAAVRRVRLGHEGPRISTRLLRMAYFRAAREGLGGQWLDVESGRLQPAARSLRALLKTVRPELEHVGEYARVSKLLNRRITVGNGATWQQQAWRRTTSVPDLVERLAHQTLTDSQPVDAGLTSVTG